MQTQETYNGWKNRETWLANLWLEECFHQDMQDGYDITSAHVKDTIENMLAERPHIGGLFSDLLQSAISEIDCYEIAAQYDKES